MASPLDILMRLRLTRDGVSAGVQNTQQQLQKLRAEGKRTGLGLRQSFKRASDQTGQLEQQVHSAKRSVAAFFGITGGALLVRRFTDTADAAKTLRARLSLVTESEAELAHVEKELYKVSQRTRSGIGETLELYAKLAQNTKDLELSQGDLLTITEAINQSFKVSGADAQASAGAIRQLSQALASGTLRGDEFNSVAEQSPRLQQAITDSLGVSRGALREMAAEGKITAEIVATALKEQSGAIAEEFAKIPPTMADMATKVGNAVTKAIGHFDRLTESTGSAVKTIDENIEEIADSVTIALNSITIFINGIQSAVNLVTGITRSIAQVVAEHFGRISGVVAAILDAMGLDEAATKMRAFSFEAGAIGESLREASQRDFNQIQQSRERMAGALAGITTAVTETQYTVAESGKIAADSLARTGEQAKKTGSTVNAAGEEIKSSLEDAAEQGGASLGKLELALDDAGAAAEGAATKLEDLSDNEVTSRLQQMSAAATANAQAVIDWRNQFPALSAATLDAVAKMDPAMLAIKKQAGEINQQIQLLRTEALQRLGIDAREVATGMSADFRKVSAVFDVLAQGGRTTAGELSAASKVMLKTAKSAQELEAASRRLDAAYKSGQLTKQQYQAQSYEVQQGLIELIETQEGAKAAQQELNAAREQGALTDGQYADAADQLRQKIDAIAEAERRATPEARRLERALAELGITSASALNRQASDAREALRELERLNAPLEVQQAGWLAVAEAELHAAGAADDYGRRMVLAGLEGEAAITGQSEALADLARRYGYTEEDAHEFGQVAVASSDSAAEALQRQLSMLERTSDEYTRVSQQLAALNQEAGRLGSRNADGSLNPGQRRTDSTVYRQDLGRLSDSELTAYRERLAAVPAGRGDASLVQITDAEMRRRGIGRGSPGSAVDDLGEERMAQATPLRAPENVDFLAGRNGPARRVELSVSLGNGSVAFFADDTPEARQILDQLEQAHGLTI